MLKNINTTFTAMFPNYYRQYFIEMEQLRIKHGEEKLKKAQKLALSTNKTIKYWIEK